MRIGSLFSGAGGLDMAVQAVFGGDIVWHSEIDKAASKVLAYRFPGVPNLGSVTDIDWATVPPVDVLCGGFPCQFGTPRTSGRPTEKSTHLGTIASLEQTTHWGKYEAAIRRWEQIVGPAPAPTEPNKNGNPRLSAAFSEWLMGWPAGWVTDPAIGISRNDQLRIVGNGVCSQQAMAALRYLLAVAEVAA